MYRIIGVYKRFLRVHVCRSYGNRGTQIMRLLYGKPYTTNNVIGRLPLFFFFSFTSSRRVTRARALPEDHCNGHVQNELFNEQISSPTGIRKVLHKTTYFVPREIFAKSDFGHLQGTFARGTRLSPGWPCSPRVYFPAIVCRRKLCSQYHLDFLFHQNIIHDVMSCGNESRRSRRTLVISRKPYCTHEQWSSANTVSTFYFRRPRDRVSGFLFNSQQNSVSNLLKAITKTLSENAMR